MTLFMPQINECCGFLGRTIFACLNCYFALLGSPEGLIPFIPFLLANKRTIELLPVVLLAPFWFQHF